MTDTANAITILLPSPVVVAKTLPIIQSRNIEESTWGGSAGNCLMTPRISPDGTALIIERERTWDQNIAVDWQVIEFDLPNNNLIISEESTISSSNTYKQLATTPAYGLPFVDIRGAGAWLSDISWYMTSIHLNATPGNSLNIPTGIACGGKQPVGTRVRYYIVPVEAFADPNALGSYNHYGWVDSWVQSNEMFNTSYNIPASATVKNMFSVVTACSVDSADSRNIPNWFTIPNSLNGTTDAILSQYNPKKIRALGTTIYQSKEVALHGQTTLNAGVKSLTVTLSKPVIINDSVVLLNAPFNNYAETDSYGEEFGDFCVTGALVNRGDGIANSIIFRRGISDGSVASRISWTILDISKSPIVQNNRDYFYRQRRIACI